MNLIKLRDCINLLKVMLILNYIFQNDGDLYTHFYVFIVLFISSYLMTVNAMKQVSLEISQNGTT